MSVRPTMTRFPSNPAEQEACGVPWGMTVAPFAAKDENGALPVYGSGGELLPRCENCWAYYNTYCEQDQWSWDCSLCGTTNGLSTSSIARYSLPQSCPENISSFIDLELPRNFTLLLSSCLLDSAAVELVNFDCCFWLANWPRDCHVDLWTFVKLYFDYLVTLIWFLFILSTI